MEEQSLAAEPRPETGSRPARRLRRRGRVPATLYGPQIDAPVSLSVDARELRAVLGTEAGTNALLSVTVDGDVHLALARQLQRHPVRGTVDHLDLVTVDRHREVDAEVPIRVVGEAVEVERADGLVEQLLYRLRIRAKPGDIPAHLDVDVSGLVVGESIRVGDIALPAGVTTDADPEEAVVSGAASQLTAELAEEEAEGEPAEEGAAPPAEGAGGAAPGEG